MRHILGKLLGRRGSVPIGTGQAGVPPGSRTHVMGQVVELRDEHAWGKNRIAAFLRRRGTGVSATIVGRALGRPFRAGKCNAPRARPRKRP